MKQLQKAFTIIEILFVIAIIGVMASLGVALMQHRAQEAKIEKSALQMQQLLQAGMAYYIDNSAWPTLGAHQAGATDFDTYLPVNADAFPWGGTYKVNPDLTKQKLLDVETPGIDKKIADRIAALLPNAEVIPNGVDTYSVLAQTTPPETGGGSSSGDTIVGTGTAVFGSGSPVPINPGSGVGTQKIEFKTPPCTANNTQLDMIAIPTNVVMRHDSHFTAGTAILDQLSATANCTDDKTCTVTVVAHDHDGGDQSAADQFQVSYIAICKPKTS